MCWERPAHFLPIEEYGVIGNCRTIALVSRYDCSIDHYATPTFDAPLIFGQLLAREGGGFFRIAPRVTTSLDLPSPPSDGQEAPWTSKQLYLPSSNVLVTRFFGGIRGIAQITDWLPISAEPLPGLRGDGPAGWEYCNGLQAGSSYGLPWVMRKVEVISGTVPFAITCQPAFDYGRESHTASADGKECTFQGASGRRMKLTVVADGGAEASMQWSIEESSPRYLIGGAAVQMPIAGTVIVLAEGQCIYVIFRQTHPPSMERSVEARSSVGKCCPVEDEVDLDSRLCERLLHSSLSFWQGWLAKCTYRGRWREAVHRSALLLKLLTYAPTGAVVASGTTSLPEQIGGSANWDYRFTWIRDAAFTVYALLRIGLTGEASDFMRWIEARCSEAYGVEAHGGASTAAGGLRLMYDVHGRHPAVNKVGGRQEATALGRACSEAPESSTLSASEVILGHWSGYKDSRPVRIGNIAAFQEQLDIYGELMDAIYLCDKWVRPISFDFWRIIRDRIIPPLVSGWRRPDHSIWEVRGEPRHYTYSKVMSWVALDRAIRLATKHSLPAPIASWSGVRDEIYEEVMERGFHRASGTFTQSYGSESLDASSLIMPLVFFISPSDPRFLTTLHATRASPKDGRGLTLSNLVFRFRDAQGCTGEGAFTMCSFWLAEALARGGRRDASLLADGRALFESILGYANHVGLYSEEIGLDGSHLGNFPQAFTHMSLISAAFNLDRILDEANGAAS